MLALAVAGLTLPATPAARAAIQSPFTRAADLGVAAAFAPSPATAGQNATLSATVTNAGPSTAEGVVLTAPLPANTSFVSAGVPGGTCAPPGGSVVCTLSAALAPAASATASIVVAVDPSAAATSLSGAATASSTTPDSASSNNTATASVPLQRSADLQVTADGPPTIVAGARVSYTVLVRNNGPSDARDVTLSDTTLNRLTPVAVDTSSGVCLLTAVPPRCDLGTIPAGAVTRVVATADAPSSLGIGDQVASTSATTSTPESSTADNSASVHSTVTHVSDLSAAVSTSGTVVAGSPVQVLVDARNAGPSDATNAVVTATVPTGFTPQSAAVDGGSCAVSGQTVTCAVGTLALNASKRITVQVLVPRVADPTADTTATAAVTSDSTASAPGDDTARATLGVTAAADVLVTSTVRERQVVAGNQTVFTLQARDDGPSQAAGVVLADTFPAGITPLSADGPGCAVSGQTVRCAVGALSSGAQATTAVTVRVEPTRATGPVTDAATVTSDPSMPDPSLSNNAAQAGTTVTAVADLLTTATGTPPGLVAGGAPGTFTVQVTNRGPSAATSAVVVEDLPDSLTPVRADVDGTACTITGPRVSCPAGTVLPGGHVVVTLVAGIDADVPAGTATVNVTSTSSAPDPDPTSARLSVQTAITTATDLQTVITPDPTTLTGGALVVGGQAVYRVDTRNAGPSDATGVSSAVTVPAGMTVVSASPSVGTCAVAGAQVTCAVDGLAAGSVDTVVLTVALAGNATGPLAVTATSSSLLADADAADGASSSLPATATTKVTSAADLAVTLSPQTDTPEAGGTAAYVVSAVNNGPSTAAGAQVVTSIPAGATVSSATLGGAACAVSGGRVSCPLGDLAPGAVATAALTLALDPGLVGVLAPTSTVSTSTPDPTSSNNAASLSQPVAARADIPGPGTSRSTSPSTRPRPPAR